MILAPDPTRTFDLLPSPRALGGYAIRCRVCGLISHHPEDIAREYCGNCHQFHDVLRRQVESGQVEPAPDRLPVVGYNSDGAAPVFQWRGGLQTSAIPALFGRGRVIACDPPNYYINPATGQEDKFASYSRYWCFPSWGAALVALLTWKPDEEPEPTGWVKAFDERRRIEGDARFEYRTPDEEADARRRFMGEVE